MRDIPFETFDVLANSLALATHIKEPMPCRVVWNPEAIASVDDPTALKILEAAMVDKDRIRGSAEQAKGKVKQVVG